MQRDNSLSRLSNHSQQSTGSKGGPPKPASMSPVRKSSSHKATGHENLLIDHYIHALPQTSEARREDVAIQTTVVEATKEDSTIHVQVQENLVGPNKDSQEELEALVNQVVTTAHPQTVQNAKKPSIKFKEEVLLNQVSDSQLLTMRDEPLGQDLVLETVSSIPNL